MTPQTFIEKWQHKNGSERANYQLFFNDLCELLGVEKPQPSGRDDWENAYVYERFFDARDDASVGAARFIDTYKRGHFICESKSFDLGKNADTTERKLVKAKAQAESYARALPAFEPRPPLLMVVNIGRFIALYAQFRDNDRAYEMFPDRASYRVALADLARDDVRERLHLAFTDPAALDPARVSARVTRAVAALLGSLARELESAGHDSHAVAGFLTRCLFSMFAEDVGLLPAGTFSGLLERSQLVPESLAPNLADLWRAMDSGGYSVALQSTIAHFNGKLFKAPATLDLSRAQIATLIEAARQDWKHVEPAIFGTLIERALDPAERHALGAHFTPRAYVERLVLPTVVEPLRRDWQNIQTAALKLDDDGKRDAALALVRDFHLRLCQLRVLDPACGSGNFLYIALEHLKRLEGDVLEQLAALQTSSVQTSSGQHGVMRQGELDTEGLTVDPHQFLGVESNPRAAAVAELVLWIGHLQWHFRNNGRAAPPAPVLRDFKNIECRDAVLDWGEVVAVLDANGQPQTRWDGVGFKPHPVTGKRVPDDTAQIPQTRYLDPRAAVWPDAEIIVGNPPFIGAATMRQALGDGYVEALRAAHPDVPESVDLVMFWWNHAAALLATGAIARFGFITTNSVTQTFNRRVLERYLDADGGADTSQANAAEPARPAVDDGLLPHPPGAVGSLLAAVATVGRESAAHPAAQPGGSRKAGCASGFPALRRYAAPTRALHLAYAIADHPWVDAADGAAVRVAMTVAAPGAGVGRLLRVVAEAPGDEGEVAVELLEKTGRIHANLQAGANVGEARVLRANGKVSQRGFELGGAGFIVTPSEAAALLSTASPPRSPDAAQRNPGNTPTQSFVTPDCIRATPLIRDYRNGRDLTDHPRGVQVIDAWGYTEAGLRLAHPAVWQWLYNRVKPERDHNRDPRLRENWWLHRRSREDLRDMLAGLPRYLATVETAKHRVFQFLDAAIAPDNKLIAIALDDAFVLGVLSSRIHGAWALAAGSTLEDRPVYVKTTCFETFPFPAATPAQQAHIAELAEQLDAHRKRQQAAHPDLTLTGLYNVLDKRRSGASLTAKEKIVHEHGLVGVLQHLHDELDTAVRDAYGWPVADDTDTLLERLVDRNRERAAEEAAGFVRWLRPAYQNPPRPASGKLDLPDAATEASAVGWVERREVKLGEVQRREVQHGEAQRNGVQQGVGLASPTYPAPSKGSARTATPWPLALPEQLGALAAALTPAPRAVADLAAQFSGKRNLAKTLPDLLAALEGFGRARRWPDGGWSAA